MLRIHISVLLIVCTWKIMAGAPLDRALDSLSDEDVLPLEDPVWTTITADYPGFAPLLNVSNDAAVLCCIREAVTNYARSATVTTNETEKMRLSCGMLLLERYDLTNSLPVFEEVVTNGLAVDVVPEAAFYLGEANGIMSGPVRGWLESAWPTLPFERRANAYEGVYRGLNSRIVSTVETNRVVSIALTCLCKNVAWKESDCEVCYLWPAYATSSNRYVAAQLARQADPPCASSNYLARVIAGLEALPPGTMQMLPTNHLGQAWGE